MNVQHNISLKNFNTFAIDEKAENFIQISTESELLEALQTYKEQKLNIIGGGSNILLTKKLKNTTILNQLKGIEIVSENDEFVFVKFMSGEVWHECVLWSVNRKLGGIENLSLIPGTIGAAPIQNIGAYGVELKDSFHCLEAIHLNTLESEIFELEECKFGYRESIFKKTHQATYFIKSVTLKLTKKPILKLEYGTIKEELAKANIEFPTIKNVSDAVIEIRQSKLPDPKKIGNAGSFFKNPVIAHNHFQKLKKEFENLPSFPNVDGVKIPAAWLIETCNWKGTNRGNYGVHDKQALVLVNLNDAKGSDILSLSDEIITSVQQRFNIELEREVNVW